MKKQIIVFAMLLTSYFGYSQEVNANKKDTEFGNFLIGLHYTGNIRNDNFVSDSFNGIAGLDGRYNFAKVGITSFQAGLSIDYLQSRLKDPKNFNFKNALIWNPNIGVEFDFFKNGFRPFVNLGYTFFNAKYTIPIKSLDYPYSTRNVDGNYNYNSFSINPGARYYFEKMVYLESSYKYLPVDSNMHLHFINIGLGVNL